MSILKATKLRAFSTLILIAFAAVPFANAKDPQGQPDFLGNLERVQIRETNTSCPVGFCTAIVFTVPDGKRLVIEYVGLRTDVGDLVAEVRIHVTFADVVDQVSIGTTTFVGPGTNQENVFGSPVNLYAQSGTIVGCSVATPNFQAVNFVSCTISGFLEDET